MKTTTQMTKALKDNCFPDLQKMGFMGFFSNVYRNTDRFAALVPFRSTTPRGTFCINLGVADPERRNLACE